MSIHECVCLYALVPHGHLSDYLCVYACRLRIMFPTKCVCVYVCMCWLLQGMAPQATKRVRLFVYIIILRMNANFTKL
jgi:hypothetical protein